MKTPRIYPLDIEAGTNKICSDCKINLTKLLVKDLLFDEYNFNNKIENSERYAKQVNLSNFKYFEGSKLRLLHIYRN